MRNVRAVKYIERNPEEPGPLEGWYVVNTETGELCHGPHPTEKQAERYLTAPVLY